MQLSKEQIQQYQQLYHHRFGEEISETAAREQGVQLLQLLKLVFVPIKKTDLSQ